MHIVFIDEFNGSTNMYLQTISKRPNTVYCIYINTVYEYNIKCEDYVYVKR